jgi:hypothetical protein
MQLPNAPLPRPPQPSSAIFSFLLADAAKITFFPAKIAAAPAAEVFIKSLRENLPVFPTDFLFISISFQPWGVHRASFIGDDDVQCTPYQIFTTFFSR